MWFILYVYFIYVMILIHDSWVCNEGNTDWCFCRFENFQLDQNRSFLFCMVEGCIHVHIINDDILCFLLKINYLYNISYIIYFLINSVQNFFLLSLNLLIVILLLYLLLGAILGQHQIILSFDMMAFSYEFL